ncbi:MAG: hypothetical protein BGO25_02780 [Acidobacteriales bacterium 59-55]|nr:energy transducer TonB [Terriglobales bacterium]OJV42441.1 MAG: hypothetical protein BGO25_02780 [Acidobacteriales bacterium 59-55]
MLFFLNMQETIERFGTQITELHGFFDTNYVQHGSPDDFFKFARTLENNNQFRNDLSALIKSIVSRERDEILLTDMMSILAAAVGGPPMEDTQADITRPTNTIMEFLLGTGCWRQFGAPSRPVSATPKPPSHVEEPHPARFSAPSSDVSRAHTSDTKDSLLDASSELRQKLTRLEINTLEVKLNLEAIEQRIRKIDALPVAHSAEPALPPEPRAPEPADNAQPIAPASPVIVPSVIAPPSVISQPVVAAEPLAQPAAENAPLFEAILPTRGRAIFSHESEDDGFPSPTFAFAGEKKRNIIPIAVFLVLLTVVAASFLLYRTSLGQGLLSHLATVRTLFSSNSDEPSSGPPPPPTPSATTPPTPAPEGTTTGITAGTAAAATPSGSGIDGAGTQSDVSSPASAGSRSATRYVQPNVMEGNLLSAPRPEYPASARTERLEGIVALQATISTSGAVKTLRAINGPQILRGAAIDAVRDWRYKPYSVDGRPVEVATTVYVHFSLKQPTVIGR